MWVSLSAVATMCRHVRVRDPPATDFSQLGHLPIDKAFVAPLFFHMKPLSSCFPLFCLRQSFSLDFSDLSWLFPIAQHPLQASLTFNNLFSSDTLVFLLIQLILLGFHLYGCQRKLIHTYGSYSYAQRV